MLNKKIIDNVVCEILYQDGPDRHIDGHEIITDFIMALLNETDEHFESEKAEEWVTDYISKKNTYEIYYRTSMTLNDKLDKLHEGVERRRPDGVKPTKVQISRALKCHTLGAHLQSKRALQEITKSMLPKVIK